MATTDPAVCDLATRLGFHTGFTADKADKLGHKQADVSVSVVAGHQGQ